MLKRGVKDISLIEFRMPFLIAHPPCEILLQHKVALLLVEGGSTRIGEEVKQGRVGLVRVGRKRDTR